MEAKRASVWQQFLERGDHYRRSISAVARRWEIKLKIAPSPMIQVAKSYAKSPSSIIGKT
ncbi:MAG: hypothetical protein ABSG65_01080 [Bryobacteraceae bacterium]|jgi:hypothetical protein